jgi:pyruvate dehydrogenase E1 component alpha subunit
MHLFDAANRMLGGHAIVGGHIPLAAGVAFAAKYQNKDHVTLCFFGDGAVSIQGFHEGVSLAALWKLPIVFVCENNEYSMGTPLSRTMSVEDVSLKAKGYGIPGDHFIATDVLEVEKRMKVAIERARKESIPSLVEVRTYRFRGHSMSDPGKYRTAAELDDHKKRDPLIHARQQLEQGDKQKLEALEADVEKEIADAVKFAEESPEPDLSVLAPATYDGPFAY